MVAINTEEHWTTPELCRSYWLTHHKGPRCRGDPVMGRRCKEAGRDVITKIVDGADLVFVTAGLEEDRDRYRPHRCRGGRGRRSSRRCRHHTIQR